MTIDPTPSLCCTHGDRIDRLVELMEDLVAVRTKPRLATGGMVRASNPSPAIDPIAVAEAVAEATIIELDRRGRLLP